MTDDRPKIDCSDLDAVKREYPVNSHVRFNQPTEVVGRILGYSRFGRDWTLVVGPEDRERELLEWHPLNTTRVLPVCRWESIE